MLLLGTMHSDYLSSPIHIIVARGETHSALVGMPNRGDAPWESVGRGPYSEKHGNEHRHEGSPAGKGYVHIYSTRKGFHIAHAHCRQAEHHVQHGGKYS